MIKIISLVLFFLSFRLAFAQDETLSFYNISSDAFYTELNKLDLEAVIASEQVKSSDKHEVNGIYTSIKTSLLYPITEKNEIRLFASYVSEDYKKDKDKAYFELGEIMYRRKSIFNHADHGFNLDVELKHAIVLDTPLKKLWGFTSETIPQVIIKKRFPLGFGAELKARHHIYERNRINASAITNEDRIYLSAYKMFAQKFLINTELRYRHKIYTGRHYSWHLRGYKNKHHEDLVIHPGLMYFLTRSTLVEGYVETKLNDTFDTRKMGQLAKDELVLGAALYVTIF